MLVYYAKQQLSLSKYLRIFLTSFSVVFGINILSHDSFINIEALSSGMVEGTGVSGENRPAASKLINLKKK